MHADRNELQSLLTDYISHYFEPLAVYCDSDNNILWCNNSFLALANLSHIPEGISINDFLSDDCILAKNNFLNASLKKLVLTFTFRQGIYPANAVIMKNNKHFLIIADTRMIADESAVECIVRLNNEMTNISRKLAKKNAALEKANAKIRRFINTDYLTKLSSRQYIHEYLLKAASFHKRTAVPIAVIMGDIDHFKKFNDRYGHIMGDRVLVKVSQIILRLIRKEDMAGRFGGEEFILILPGADKDSGIYLAERIRKNVEQLKISGLQDTVTISFGVTEFKAEDTTDTVIKRADEALYLAKQQGRNRVVALS